MDRQVGQIGAERVRNRYDAPALELRPKSVTLGWVGFAVTIGAEAIARQSRDSRYSRVSLLIGLSHSAVRSLLVHRGYVRIVGARARRPDERSTALAPKRVTPTGLQSPTAKPQRNCWRGCVSFCSSQAMSRSMSKRT